jgi:hypothetical protein
MVLHLGAVHLIAVGRQRAGDHGAVSVGGVNQVRQRSGFLDAHTVEDAGDSALNAATWATGVL